MIVSDEIHVDLSGVCKTYILATQKDRVGFKTVLKNISFGFGTGDILGIVGLNGSGKTTLFKVLSGYTCNTVGSFTLNGYRYSKDIDSSAFLRASFGTLVSGDNLPGYMNLIEYVNCMLSYRNIPNLYSGRPDIDKRFESICEAMNIDSRFFESNISTYSKGMKQKVSIISTLTYPLPAYFLDEPSVGLDAFSVACLYSWIKKTSEEENVSFLLTSHTTIELIKICSNIFVMEEGTIMGALDVLYLKSNYNCISINFHCFDVFLTEKLKIKAKFLLKKMSAKFNFLFDAYTESYGIGSFTIVIVFHSSYQDEVKDIAQSTNWNMFYKTLLPSEAAPEKITISMSQDYTKLVPLVENLIVNPFEGSNILGKAFE